MPDHQYFGISAGLEVRASRRWRYKRSRRVRRKTGLASGESCNAAGDAARPKASAAAMGTSGGVAIESWPEASAGMTAVRGRTTAMVAVAAGVAGSAIQQAGAAGARGAEPPSRGSQGVCCPVGQQSSCAPVAGPPSASGASPKRLSDSRQIRMARGITVIGRSTLGPSLVYSARKSIVICHTRGLQRRHVGPIEYGCSACNSDVFMRVTCGYLG
jgi:hypothetical protein